LPLTETDIIRRLEMRESPHIRERIVTIIRELMQHQNDYLKPAVAYEIYPREAITSEYLKLESGRIKGRSLSAILSEAAEMAAVACTIGNSLEQTVEAYFRSGDSLKGLLLDGMGSAAVDILAREAGRVIQQEVSARGYDISGPLSPGMHGWNIKQLPNLLRLTPANQIGISLTIAGMLQPRKSVVMLLGIGHQLCQWDQVESCESCNLKQTCRHRVR